MWKPILAVVLAVVIVAGVLVGSANAAAPGDLLYGLDRGMETMQLRLTSSPLGVARLNQALAHERLDEVQKLAWEGDTAHLDQALENLSLALQANGSSADAAADQAAAALSIALGQSTSGERVKDKDKEKEKVKGPKDKDKEKDLDKDQDPDGEETKEPNDGAYCDGSQEKHHPSGDKLAGRYGVSYEEVMGWFCQGYGFGEVDLAYSIHREANVSVGQVFEQRASGLGWGEILEKYGMQGKPDKEKEKKAKPKDQD
ncbi:MAG: DUF5667 domain-containing protein [Chloroflexota bacterium]